MAPTPQPTPVVIELDSFSKMHINKAKKIIDSYNYPELKLNIKKQYSSKYKKNYVIKQSVKKGTLLTVHEPLTLTLYVSKGVRKVTVPNVKGIEYSSAKSKINKAGLLTDEIWVYSESPYGVVVEQSVEAGKKLQERKSITLTISLGPKPVITPKPKKTPKPEDDEFVGEIF